MALGIDAFRSAALRRELIDIPDMGGGVYVRVLTMKEVREIQRAQKNAEPLDVYPRLVRMAVVTEDGTQVFGEGDLSTIDQLPWPTVEAIASKALALSGMSGEKSDPKDS